MAAGAPVITTPTGIEGLSARNYHEALIASSETGLADLTIRVLTDTKLYSKLANNGRKLVESKFSWKSIAQRLDNIYRKAV